MEHSNCDAETIVELDWIIADDTVVRPDVMVVCGEPPDGHMHETPGLVAEVLSDSTRQNDLTYKRQLYHREGVDAYLVVDPVAETITIDRRQKRGDYVTENVTGDLSIDLCERCQVRMDRDAIFRRSR